MTALSGQFNKDINTTWVSDSGATFHVCGDKAWYCDFTTLEPENAPLIELADSRLVKPLGIGTVIVDALWDGEWVETTISDVFYLPGGANLFSELVMCKKGYKIHRCLKITKFVKDGKVGPVAKIQNDAFVMQFSSSCEKFLCSSWQVFTS